MSSGNDSTRAIPPDLLAARRLTDETRRLIGALVATQAPADALEEATAAVAEAADRLAPYASTSRYDRTTITVFGQPGTEILLEDHPFLGPANPIAPPLVIDADDTVGMTATYDHRHEGHRGCVHGGVLAAAFDLVLALAATRATGRAGWTGTLTVKYRAPTPLRTPLRYSAEADPAKGRTVRVHGRVAAGDVVTAEAEVVYVLSKTGEL
jgi:acyl-coenzyme A thioesterase PaaI-like protein